jgi:hypothetical protein
LVGDVPDERKLVRYNSLIFGGFRQIQEWVEATEGAAAIDAIAA